jgi:uncharacterized protein with GYD domain
VVTIKSAYYKIGAYDEVVVVEGADDVLMTTLLKLGLLGNARTQTLRAFSPDEMRGIVGKMP